MARRPVPLARLQQLIPSLRGLTRTEVDERRQEYGPNEIVEDDDASVVEPAS